MDEDWADCDPDELLRDRCGEVPFLPHATYCFVGAALAPIWLGPGSDAAKEAQATKAAAHAPSSEPGSLAMGT